MVCSRCRTIVKAVLDNINVSYTTVELGEISTTTTITPALRVKIYDALQESGFELVDEHNNDLMEKLHKALVNCEYYSYENLRANFLNYMVINDKDSFLSLNILFIAIEGITIEKYFVKQKIERVKEMLTYDDLNLEEIAQKMHYSSTAQLSGEFKRVTGLAPLYFRQLWRNSNNNPEIN